MAYPAITNLPTAQKPAGIKKVYIKNGSELWQTMGFIRNGELKITPNKTENTYKKNIHINSYMFEAKFEVLQTSVAQMELIPSIVNGVTGVHNNWLFQLTDSGVIPSSAGVTAGWVTVTPAQVKATVSYKSDGNPSTNQFMEITVKGTVLASALDACIKASIDDGDFTIAGTSAQTFSAFGNYTLCSAVTDAGKDTGVLGDIKPNGFASVGLDDVLSAGADEVLPSIRNGKITIDCASEDDSLGRPNCYGFNIDVEYESTLTDDATLLLVDQMNAINTSAVVTLLDGKVFTFDQELGFDTTFENVGDFDKMRILRFKHVGRILTSQLAGIVG